MPYTDDTAYTSVSWWSSEGLLQIGRLLIPNCQQCQISEGNQSINQSINQSEHIYIASLCHERTGGTLTLCHLYSNVLTIAK